MRLGIGILALAEIWFVRCRQAVADGRFEFARRHPAWRFDSGSGALIPHSLRTDQIIFVYVGNLS